MADTMMEDDPIKLQDGREQGGREGGREGGRGRKREGEKRWRGGREGGKEGQGWIQDLRQGGADIRGTRYTL